MNSSCMGTRPERATYPYNLTTLHRPALYEAVSFNPSNTYAEKIIGWGPGFAFLQDANNLFFAESFYSHLLSSRLESSRKTNTRLGSVIGGMLT